MAVLITQTVISAQQDFSDVLKYDKTDFKLYVKSLNKIAKLQIAPQISMDWTLLAKMEHVWPS